MTGKTYFDSPERQLLARARRELNSRFPQNPRLDRRFEIQIRVIWTEEPDPSPLPWLLRRLQSRG